MRTITIEVKEETARLIERLSDKEKEELNRRIDFWIQDRRSLQEVMDDMSEYALKQGLTPDLLEQLLNT